MLLSVLGKNKRMQLLARYSDCRPRAGLLAVAMLCLFALPALAITGPQGDRRHALVVGNAAYKTVPALENSVNDSREICSSLKKLGFQTTCISDVKTKGQFKELVSKFVQGVRKGDIILFYFAGHGVEMDGENYLVPTMAEFRSRNYFEDEALKVNYVLEELAATGSRLSVVILDACRDNPFGAKARSAVGRGLAVPTRAPAGSIIIFPTSPGKVALDSGSGSQNGLFTKYLLANISTPGLEVENMFKRVIEGVKSESEKIGQAQIPWMNLSFTGEFCFAGCVDREADAREKEQLALRAKELEQQLTHQQKQSDEFRARMQDMETKLAAKLTTVSRDSQEFSRLEKERAELAQKVAMLESQDQSLKKAQQSMLVYQQSKSSLQKIDLELSARQKRLQEIESLLQTSRSISGSLPKEVVVLRKERDDLKKTIQKLLGEKKELEGSDKSLAEIARITKQSEQAQQELASYRDRLALLEKDARLKDEQLSTERKLREQTQNELKDAKRSAVKGAAVVAPAF